MRFDHSKHASLARGGQIGGRRPGKSKQTTGLHPYKPRTGCTCDRPILDGETCLKCGHTPEAQAA